MTAGSSTQASLARVAAIATLKLLKNILKMAWRCSGTTNDELIRRMVEAELITSPIVATREAFREVDRRHYVPQQGDAYQDSPQLLGYNATISAPHMHASAVEILLPLLGRGRRVLDVGSGSGYCAVELVDDTKGLTLMTAVFHQLCPDGIVIGVDHIPGLVELGRKNLTMDNVKLGIVDDAGVDVILGDGRQGCAEFAPFDAIHVGAAAASIPPALIDQLARPGRLFIPVGPSGGAQSIWQVDKLTDGRVERQCLYGVRYVPLTDASRQWAP